MTEMTLTALLRARPRTADRPLLQAPGGRAMSDAGFDALTAQLAHALAALGVQQGDRVAAQVEKSPEALCLYVASLRAGAVFLPLNTAYTPAEVAGFVADATPRLIVCDPAAAAGMQAIAAGAGAGVATLGAAGEGSLPATAAAFGGHFEDRAVAQDDLAAIVYTSGTTGRAKGAMLTHRNLASNALVLRDFWRFSAGDVLLHALPIHHVHGLFVASHVALLAGAGLLFLPRFDVDAVFAMLPRATAMMGVPTFYTRLLEDPRLTRDRVRHMRLFISGSAPLLAATHAAFAARTGHAILERYGMTETGMNTSNPVDGARLAGTVGVALPGVEVRITDPARGTILPAGRVGMIEVRGANVFRGYWRLPEKTAQEFRPDGFFITGDLGDIDAHGYLRIVGRGKDLIITGGLNVYPKEVELGIDALPGVLESAVIGLPHPDFGEGVIAVVVPAPGAVLDAAEMRRTLATTLAAFKLPKRIFFAADLPRNSMGKVLKTELRHRYAGAFGPAGDVLPPG